MADDRYVFLVEWFDTAASLVRSYNLTYFAIDGTIEMVRCSRLSSISKTKRSSSDAASTPVCSSRIYSSEPSSLSIPVS